MHLKIGHGYEERHWKEIYVDEWTLLFKYYNYNLSVISASKIIIVFIFKELLKASVVFLKA